VVRADISKPGKAALAASHNQKCACKIYAIELVVFLIAGDLPPALPVHRRLDEPGFQMRITRSAIMYADSAMSWDKL
jgi:hypothetical protein